MDIETKFTNESATPIVQVSNVSKKFCYDLKRSLWYGVKDIGKELMLRGKNEQKVSLRNKEFWALQNISFELRQGESLAIIGANGAGKSTLLKLLYGLIKPDSGEIHIRGNIGAMIELGVGFDPVLSGRENIYIRAAILGLSRNKVTELLDQIVEFAELEKFIDSPVQYYSSGMVARLSFAVSAHLNPNLLLVDEILAVGDLDFQRKCTNHMLKYLASGGSIILVSHDLNHIQSTCKRGILLENGRLNFEGTAVEALNKYFQNQVNKTISYQGLSQNDVIKGKGSIIIEEILLEPINSENIQTGKTCCLTVKYHSEKQLEKMFWGFSITTHNNQQNITGNYDLTPRTIQEGCGELRCIIHVTLLTGTYLLKVVIGELSSLHAVGSLGYNDAPHQFSVLSPPDMLDNFLQSINQLVTVNVEWH